MATQSWGDWFRSKIGMATQQVKDTASSVAKATGLPDATSPDTATELLKTAPEGAQPMLGGRRRKTKKLRRKSKKTRKH
jgi:hypothetical protein